MEHNASRGKFFLGAGKNTFFCMGMSFGIHVEKYHIFLDIFSHLKKIAIKGPYRVSEHKVFGNGQKWRRPSSQGSLKLPVM